MPIDEFDAKREADFERRWEEGLKLRKDSAQRKILQFFRGADVDGSGTLDCNELGTLLKKLDPKFSDANIKATFDLLDRHRDGTINYEEFVNWVMAGDESEARKTLVKDCTTVKKKKPMTVDERIIRNLVERFKVLAQVSESAGDLQAALAAAGYTQFEDIAHALRGENTMELAERRFDPNLGGRAVTYSKMKNVLIKRSESRGQFISDAQLFEHWNNLQVAQTLAEVEEFMKRPRLEDVLREHCYEGKGKKHQAAASALGEHRTLLSMTFRHCVDSLRGVVADTKVWGADDQEKVVQKMLAIGILRKTDFIYVFGEENAVCDVNGRLEGVGFKTFGDSSISKLRKYAEDRYWDDNEGRLFSKTEEMMWTNGFWDSWPHAKTHRLNPSL